MRIDRIMAVACVMLATGSISYSAGPASRPVESSARTAEYVRETARQLASADPIEAEAAIIRFSFAPPEDFPLIEAEAADPSLDPKAAAKFKSFLERQRPWQAPRQRIAKARQEKSEWIRSTALEAYEKAGLKDPRWDESARQAIKLFFNSAAPANAPARSAAEKAIEAGCNDPFLLYIEARLLEGAGTRDNAAVERFYQLAAEAMFKSEYPAYRQIECYIHAFQHRMDVVSAQGKPGEDIPLKEWLGLQTLISHAEDEFPDLMDDNPPAAVILDTATQLVDVVPESYHKEVFDAIHHAWQKAAPDDTYLLTFTGRFYVTYAWDARGSGLANTVTPQGWKDMRERLATAADALTAAWEKDNTNADAAVAMLTVELGQGQGRNRMELWYRRAIEADPDNERAVAGKMYYLNPQWHGSQQDMLVFAHQLYETQNWRAGFPLQLAQVYDQLASSNQDPQAFLAAPQVWQDIQTVWVPYVRAYPEPNIRSGYCYRACRCGQWDIAKQQFKLLGNKADPEQFGGEDAMKAFRAQAEQKGT